MGTSEIDTEMGTACEALRARLEIVRAPTIATPIEDWMKLPPAILRTVPTWLPNLVARHPFTGLVLEHYRHDMKRLFRFSFLTPGEYLNAYQEGSIFSVLPAMGYTLIGQESDGNMWVLRGDPLVTAEVYFLDLSEWNPSKALARKNGLHFAATRLAHLLSTMTISEATYYNTPRGPHSILWFP
jgi:hypothetical protein